MLFRSTTRFQRKYTAKKSQKLPYGRPESYIHKFNYHPADEDTVEKEITNQSMWIGNGTYQIFDNRNLTTIRIPEILPGDTYSRIVIVQTMGKKPEHPTGLLKLLKNQEFQSK